MPDGSAPSPSILDALGRVDAGCFEPDPSWINSFGVVFGGVTVAVLVDAWVAVLDDGESLGSAHLAFAKPLREGATTITVERAAGGRTVGRLLGTLRRGDDLVVDGFAVTARRAGATVGRVPTLDLPPPDELDETVDPARAAAFVQHHFDIRVARRPSAEDPVVHQWVRIRRCEPIDGRLPLAAAGLLADLVGTGVFRTATRELEGLQAVKSLDLSLHLTGVAPTEWTLLSIATPPIHDGGAVAHATLRTRAGEPVATVAQQVLVQPIER